MDENANFKYMEMLVRCCSSETELGAGSATRHSLLVLCAARDRKPGAQVSGAKHEGSSNGATHGHSVYRTRNLY